MSTVSKAHALEIFDALARQSEQQRPLGSAKRSQIKAAIRRAHRASNNAVGDITADALGDRELLPDFALELLRLKAGSSSIIGDAKTFSEAAKKLEDFSGKYARDPDVVQEDGTERHLSPHLETIYRTFILGVGSMETPKDTTNAAGVSGHQLFSDSEPLVELKLVPSDSVDPKNYVRVVMVERDGETFAIPSDRAVSGNLKALNTDDLRSLQPKTPIRWDHTGKPLPGSKGVATSPEAPEPRTYDLEIVMEVHGKPQSIGLLTRDIGGWGAGKHYRVTLSDTPELRDTPLRFRTHNANNARLEDLSVESLSALEVELDRLLSSTPSESYGATIVHAVKEEIGPAKIWREERDAERTEAVSKASSTLEDFQYGPGLIAEVAMHELMELAKRIPGVNRDD